ncbi:MAG: OB-fold nucleic acid binding domain-containing protein [Deltaproteobacteria bacterium]|nr:OB-fold nucleic acid binding domain-containing protein [Deltaproteobacteria bacterium]
MNRLKHSNYFFLQTRAVSAVLFFLVFFLVPLFIVQQADGEEPEQVLPESGIHYPGGFDPNTVGTVEGRVSEYHQPKRGPVRFQLESRRDTYTVLVSPAWYWNDLGAAIPAGTGIRVRGSKSLGKDGKLYIIVQEMNILSSEQSLVFRSKDGFPLWKGSRRGVTGGHRGYGSYQGGMSGMSRSKGGMSRGRR